MLNAMLNKCNFKHFLNWFIISEVFLTASKSEFQTSGPYERMLGNQKLCILVHDCCRIPQVAEHYCWPTLATEIVTQ